MVNRTGQKWVLKKSPGFYFTLGEHMVGVDGSDMWEVVWYKPGEDPVKNKIFEWWLQLQNHYELDKSEHLKSW